MSDALDLELGNELDWLKGSAQSIEEGEQPGEKPAAGQLAETLTTVKPVETPAQTAVEPEKPSDEPLPIPEYVENLGGEDGARHFIPLANALREASGEDDQDGKILMEALKKTLTPDQFGAVLFAQYNQFGELFVKQMIEEKPEYFAQFGFVKAEPEDAFDDDFDDDDLSPRERKLAEQLKQQGEQIQALLQDRQKTVEQSQEVSQATIVENARAEMFGTVISKAEAQLKDWPTEDVTKAVNIAMGIFSQDAKAIEAYNNGIRYHRTNEPVLKADVSRAKAAFSKCFADGIAVVQAQRGQTPTTKPPVEPTRREFNSTTTAASQGNDRPAVTVEPGKLFDARTLMDRVDQRLAQR